MRINSFLATIILALFIGGCSAAQPVTTPNDSSASDTMAGMDHSNMNTEMPFDAMFIDGMIEHHQCAIAMAEMALEQAEHEEIRTLAEAIIAAQNAEIEQMQGWLADWYGISE